MIEDLILATLLGASSCLSGVYRALLRRAAGYSLVTHPIWYGLLLCAQSQLLFFSTSFLLNITPVSITPLVRACILCGVCLLGKLWWYWRPFPDLSMAYLGEMIFVSFLRLSVLVLIAVVISLLFILCYESVRFFSHVPFQDFILGLQWMPVVTADGSCFFFGAVPLVVGTLLMSGIAMCIAGPFGLISAVYLSEYASQGTRKILKPFLEMLAGIPTVIYGFFAAIFVAPWICKVGQTLGLQVSLSSSLAAGIVMGFMIFPLMFSLCDDVIRAVPLGLKEGALALGATSYEMIWHVILPAAYPGILASLLLGVSRAIGETMLVVMAAGTTAHLTLSPLQATTTITAQIVALLTGDQESESPKTLAAFALGLLLFTITLMFNMLAVRILRRHKRGITP